MATMKTMSFGTLMLLLLLNYSGYTTAIRKCPASLSKYSLCNASPTPAPEPLMPSQEQPVIFPTPVGIRPVAAPVPVLAPEPSKPSGEEPITAQVPAPVIIDIESITFPNPAPEPSMPSGKEPTMAPVPAPGPSKPSNGEPAPPKLNNEEPMPPELPSNGEPAPPRAA